MTVTGTAARCTRPGCSGSIEDGYCNVCGLAAQPAGAAGEHPSAPSGPSSGGTSASMSTRSRRARAGSSRAARGRLGAGLIDISPVPARDPATAVLANPQVPENKRFCGNCERPVGRSRDGRPGLAEGFCPHCGTKFSFSPKLRHGDLVAGQYEVLGCLAHGGLGWIYLAMDHHLGNRWVVLKGLLNTGDAAAQEAAVAERRFLAEVEHPNIVGVYNFVQHPDAETGEPTGYIVMEYVGGESLRQILLERRKTGESMPVPMALAYMIEVLPALGYLHGRGLVYCDFKPDNVIQREEQLKLIDMGGVRRIDDEDSAIYGTVGYQAPEIATDGPSVASDLYTVGRALAVLTFEFTGYQSRFSRSLPEPADVPVLERFNSFLRVLKRATNTDPEQRFGSAGEMAEQLTGVLREVLAVTDGKPRPAFSTLFSGEIKTIGVPGAELADQSQPAYLARPGAAELIAGLPAPAVDTGDPAAGYLATLSTLEAAQRLSALDVAVHGHDASVPQAVADSLETKLALARALITCGRPQDASTVLDAAAADPDADWRVTWYQGLLALAAGQPGKAQSAFDAVLDALPGEPAPKLALGLAAEAAGDPATAAKYLSAVWTTDRSYVSAAFGLARIMVAGGDKATAVRTLMAVPETSSRYTAAEVAAVRIRLSPVPGARVVSADDLQAAGQLVGRLQIDDELRQRLTAEVLQAALDRVLGGEPLGAERLLGTEPSQRGLRFGLERSYREQARHAVETRRRIELVDLANRVRPRTWA